jgi:hypothetical protein
VRGDTHAERQPGHRKPPDEIQHGEIATAARVVISKLRTTRPHAMSAFLAPNGTDCMLDGDLSAAVNGSRLRTASQGK